MLPGNAYYDKESKFLGYYEYKAWGTFFPKQNYIFNTATEFWNLLKQDFGIEYKSWMTPNNTLIKSLKKDASII
ncbi:hypothetical protein GvMRE_Ic3g97 [endosymbiont GvMRE of Glomus versiforme]|nr:hypothetical protein GvMRE_Ic3g97 [endosymbiont GvMRE of Glomus versiforme]